MATKKTDNHFLADKVALRAKFLPDKDIITVLDVFSGHGKVWAAVEKITKKNIVITKIDKRNDLIEFHLHGDNVKILQAIDVTKFSIIDVDAYGIPYDQLKILFNKKYTGDVFATVIQSSMGQINHDLLIDLGFTKNMITKAPTIYGKRGFCYFKQWLALNGVKSINIRSWNRKHYLHFRI